MMYLPVFACLSHFRHNQ